VQQRGIVGAGGRESSAPRSRIAFRPRDRHGDSHQPSAADVPPAPTQPIVLVDDEKSYTELLTQLLSDNLNCRVHSFSRPADALAMLAAIDPGVIVTDYYMPELNGLEFIRAASKVVPQARFVLISGHNLSASEPEMAQLPALQGFLAKPFGWRKLADEILRVWPETSAAPRLRESR
jgi:DNA-binding NtrC family response regulator